MRTALVTGATSGLGEEFCWQLAAAGHDIVLVARRTHILDHLADRLRNVAGVRAETINADLSKADDLARVAARLDACGEDGTAPVGLLVNNAGFGLGVPFPDNDLDRELAGLDVMVRAPMVLAHHAIASMRARGHGAILNVASVASMTGAGTYSAHKAWIVAFTEGLSEELRGTGVTATCVLPGPTRTAFFANAGLDMSGTPEWLMLDPDAVVSDALNAVRLGRVIVTPGLAYKSAMAAMKHSPRWAVRRVMRAVPHM